MGSTFIGRFRCSLRLHDDPRAHAAFCVALVNVMERLGAATNTQTHTYWVPLEAGRAETGWHIRGHLYGVVEYKESARYECGRDPVRLTIQCSMEREAILSFIREIDGCVAEVAIAELRNSEPATECVEVFVFGGTPEERRAMRRSVACEAAGSVLGLHLDTAELEVLDGVFARAQARLIDDEEGSGHFMMHVERGH